MFDQKKLEYVRASLSVEVDRWGRADPSAHLKWRGRRRVAQTSAGAILPKEPFDGDAGPDRWRACRQVWTQLARIDSPPETFAKASRNEIEARGTVPGTDVPLDDFLDAVERCDRLVGQRGARKKCVQDEVGAVPTLLARHVLREFDLGKGLEDVSPAPA